MAELRKRNTLLTVKVESDKPALVVVLAIVLWATIFWAAFKMIPPEWKIMAMMDPDDPAVVGITASCVNETYRLNCLVNQAYSHYNYSRHNDSIRTPSEYIEQGGDCKDYAVVIGSIFKRDGWEIKIIRPIESHVSVIASKPCEVGNCTQYCYIEGKQIMCEVLK